MLLKPWNLFLSMRSGLLSLSVGLMLTITLNGCSPLDIAKTVLGGGGVNANAQFGKENVQGVNISSEAPTVTVRPKARVDNIDQSSGNKVENAETVNNINGVPLEWWIITVLVALVGWLLDSPQTVIRNIFKK